MSLQPSLVPSTLTPTLSHFFLLGLRHARQYQTGYGLSPSFSVSALSIKKCVVFLSEMIALALCILNIR